MSDSNNVTEQEIRKAMALSIGRKSVVIAILLWLFLGGFGVHRMYLGKVASGVVMAILTIVGWFTLAIVIGIIPLLIVFVWWVFDLIMIIVAANKHNKVHDTLSGK